MQSPVATTVPPRRRYFLRVGWKRAVFSKNTKDGESPDEVDRQKESPAVPFRHRPYVKLNRANPIPSGWLEVMSRLTEELPVCLGDKALTKTDVTNQHNRFKLTNGMQTRLLKILREEELREVHGVAGLKVRVFDRTGRFYVLDLRFWDSCRWYVLKGKDYMKFVDDNGLHENVLLTAWTFRSKRRLCFALLSS